MNFKRFIPDILRHVRREKYSQSPGGILLFNDSLKLAGWYEEGVNGRDFRVHKNLIPDAGILHVLGVVWGATAKISAWYIAPFSGATAPAAGWTAANFASNASEITSTTEGYSESVRQQAVMGSAASGAIDNYSSKASFSIVCTTTLSITGAGLLSSNVRGGTSGTLSSAIQFATAREVQNADVWQAGYRVTLSDS